MHNNIYKIGDDFLKKINKFLSIGLIIIALMLLLKHFSVQLPNFFEELCYGIGVGLELFGIYLMFGDTSKFRNYKIRLVKK